MTLALACIGVVGVAVGLAFHGAPLAACLVMLPFCLLPAANFVESLRPKPMQFRYPNR